MPPFKDLSGQRYGRLVVIKRNGTSSNKKSTWLCQCDCGNMTTVIVDKLKSGRTKSCGCIAKETAVINGRKNNGDKHRVHGMSRHPLDAVFDQMKQRRFITTLDQNNNTRKNRFYEIDGQRKSISEWARISGLAISCVYERLKRGLSIEEALIPGDKSTHVSNRAYS